MGISIAEATAALLKGSSLSWPKFQEHKAGVICLGSSAQRRLFKFLLKQPSAKLTSPDAAIFKGLIDEWNGSSDPAGDSQSNPGSATNGVWRLVKLEASGFGGLTVFGGPTFELWINGENWCLEGQNGSGKTSFTNAILWALTGKRLIEQDGLVDDEGRRAPVYSDSGAEIGQWPPLISYPEKASDLGKDAKVWVRLTFDNGQGETSIAYRETTTPREGDPQTVSQIDARLLTIPQLIETGLLMPARIPRIGFGNKSQSLYEAVKLLTGLDQLADIAEAARLVTNRAQPFLKYAKQQGVEVEEKKFKENITKAEEKAPAAGLDISQLRTLGQKNIGQSLKNLSTEASVKAGEHLATLKAEIAEGLDTTKAIVRAKIKDAAASARTILTQGVKTIPEFEAWVALKLAKDNDGIKKLPEIVAATKIDLNTALGWHKRQSGDHKLRLKALAAQYYVVPEKKDEIGVCPLCMAQLTSAQQLTLKAEFAELKAHADAAERKLGDVCAALEKQLGTILTAELRKHLDLLASMDPKDAYASAARARFVQEEPFKSILTGIARLTEEIVTQQSATLPAFQYPEPEQADAEIPSVATEVLIAVHNLERLKALVDWWAEHGQSFHDAWTALVQQKDDTGKYLARTIAGQIEVLEQAIDRAEPLDELAKSLSSAAEASDAWDSIQEQQNLREAIAEALEPLKELRLLVSAETAVSIAGLSGRIKEILNRIHLRERLDYADASLEKKAVHVEGSFDPGIRIDAALVANTSWLRAILWAFVLALREQTIDGLKENPFPLAVMDDPQATFDPRNKRKWAEVLASSANADRSDKQGTQLIVTTHEQQFFKFLVNEQKLAGQQGLIAAVNKVNRVATVANGNSLVRSFDAAIAANDDALAHKYTSDVRIYCEDLLKCIMRAESPGIANMNLESLKKELKKLSDAHVRPFDRGPFIDLSNLLSGGGGAPMKLINDSHHQFDTIGVAQAHDVKAFWEEKLQPKLHQVFQVYAQFEAFSGDPRMFTWDETVVAFPASRKDEIKKIILLNTGVAAAAKSDGRVGDGAVTIKEWETAKPIALYNHEIYQLTSGTLDPVAAIGDLLIVCNHAPVTKHSLVVAAFGNQMLARRYNESDVHPDIAILTGQTLEPHEIPQPVIAPKEKIIARKIVGTIFATHAALPPAKMSNAEVAAIPDLAVAEKLLNNARLFEVQGRSAEPIALETQYLITHPTKFGDDAIKRLDGRLVLAVDESGARYFKRLRVRLPLAILESLNPDGTTAAELLSLDGSLGLPKLTDLLEVVGILFELPDAAKGKN